MFPAFLQIVLGLLCLMGCNGLDSGSDQNRGQGRGEAVPDDAATVVTPDKSAGQTGSTATAVTTDKSAGQTGSTATVVTPDKSAGQKGSSATAVTLDKSAGQGSGTGSNHKDSLFDLLAPMFGWSREEKKPAEAEDKKNTASCFDGIFKFMG